MSAYADAAPVLPAYIRADGAVRLRFRTVGDRTRLIEYGEGGGYRVRTPRREGAACTAVLLNTGGGMAGGDRLRVEARTQPGAAALITTQAAEKIYRSQGPASEIDVALSLAPSSRLDWLPQETILFSGSILHRRLTVDMAGDAALTIGEATVFGRAAMNEVFETGTYRDRWRIRRDGSLIFAEDVRLDGMPAQLLARPAAGNGARAMATILHIGPDAEARLDDARAVLARGTVECAAGAWQGMSLIRFLAQDARALRTDFMAAMAWLRGDAMPRSW
jgi:urease accessory protein